MSHSYCAIRWWEDFSWLCKYPEHLSKGTVVHETEAVIYSYPEFYVGMIFVLIAGILGSLIVSLIDNKLDLFFEPLEKKYESVQVRKRLESMNGHP